MNLVSIVDYQPQHQPYFEKFNRYWIEKYFEMEPLDEVILCNPEQGILKPGGAILMALYDGVVAGTIALRKVDEVSFELTKMGVEDRFHRKGIARALILACFEKAKQLGAKSIVLYTNSILKPAIYLYEKVGFTHVPACNEEYKRADVKMVITL